MDASEEQHLIQRCKAGDAGAFAPLYDAHVSTAVRTAYYVTGDWAKAEDAVQEAFVRAFRHMDSFEAGRRFAPWLYRIVVNEARRLLGRQQDIVASNPRTMEAGLAVERETPESALVHEAQHQAIRSALAELAESDRTVLVLKYFAELSYDDMAQVLEVPVSTVRSRLYVARQRLRKRLTRFQREEA